METNWKLGDAPGFWMEKNTPSGLFWYYTFDAGEPPWSKERYQLINFLDWLGIIQYGTIYETIDCIRIRAR